jgi:hypothetical protein
VIDVRERVLHTDPAWIAARKAAEIRRQELERQAAGEGGHYIPLLKGGGTPREEVSGRGRRGGGIAPVSRRVSGGCMPF